MTQPSFKLKFSTPFRRGIIALLLISQNITFNAQANGAATLEWLMRNLSRTQNGARIARTVEEASEARLALINQEFRDYWKAKYGAGAEARTLTRDTILDASELSKLDRILTRQFAPEVRAVHEAEAAGREALGPSRRRTMAEIDADLASVMKKPAEAAEEAVIVPVREAMARAQTKGLWNRMNECLANETRAEAEERNAQAILGQMIRSGALTAGGNITEEFWANAVSKGYKLVFNEALLIETTPKEFDRHFAFDMGWGLVNTFIKSKFVNFRNISPSLKKTMSPEEFSQLPFWRRAWESQDPIFIKWWQGGLVDLARTPVEPIAHFYYIEILDYFIPDDENQGITPEEKDEITYLNEITKLHYNATWNGVTSPVSPFLSQFIRGIRCINNNSKFSRGATLAGSFGVSFIQSGFYFAGRRFWIGY